MSQPQRISQSQATPAMTVRRVLAPVDGSELSLRAAEAAAELASRLGASVTLLTAVEPPVVAGAYLSEAVLREVRLGAEQALKALLDQAVARVRPLQPHVETRIVMGTPAVAIAAEADGGYDLVVMGSRGMGLAPADRHLLGSVAEGVLRRTHCPVLVIPDRPEP
jgi:nucleotide-binding universal stress UspA family protein